MKKTKSKKKIIIISAPLRPRSLSSRPYCDLGRIIWASRPQQKPGAPGVGRRPVRHHRALPQSAAVVRCKSSTCLQPSPPKSNSIQKKKN